MSNYTGVIIEESLIDKSVLQGMRITATQTEPVTEKHQTPWLSQWTLHTVEIPEDQADGLAKRLSTALDPRHSWYIDFRNNTYHYVVFRNKVFKLDRSNASDYAEMVAYGISVSTPDYQLPNFSDLPIDVLEAFLKEANIHTYANESAEKVASLRPGSYDYHYEKGELALHDTYFGATKFMGEEIVYKNGTPAWGMNYYGFTLRDDIDEALYDAILRPALMAEHHDSLPIRGPKEFKHGEWVYTFKSEGTLANFTGLEEISKKGVVVCRLYCHGGFIS